MSQTHKQKIAALLAVTLILCDLMSGSPAHLQARQKNNQTEWSEEPTPEPTVEPTAEPTEEPEPTVTPQPAETPKPVEKYELVSPHAKYYKGGMKGIHYRRVKGKKVYHLYSYTTDSVKLVMSQASVFEVYGGTSKKEVKKKLVTVSSSGVVKCKTKNKKIYTLLKATSKVTGKSCYIYIYFNEKIKIIKELFISSKLNKNEIYELNASLDFFQKEFFNLDSRTKGILISEITRITNTFISDYDVLNTFCSPKEKLSFDGFSSVINEGKIVVLNMNIAEYSLLSKIIAAYLKLDFQTEVLQNLSNNKSKISVFICDEYDKYCTKTDGDFFSVSREAKCINIVSTQSYSSLKNALKDDASVKVIIQNLINKIWFRTDDLFTIEEAQKQLGKEEKVKISRSISESAKETKFSYITNTLNSQGSNISESYNSYKQNDFIFETNFFTQNLETFTALTFLSDGNKIYKPSKIKLYPYFKERD